jgi:LysM repeat protein
MTNSSTKRASRRCPSCGSRVPELASVCEVCGHEFGTTQAIPPVQPKTERKGQPATQAGPVKQPSLLSRLPWGVIGVMAVIVGLLAGALFLLRDGRLPAGISPTVEMIVNTPEGGAPAAAVTDSAPTLAPTETPVPATPTPTPAPTATPAPPLEYTIEAGDTCGGIAQKFGVSLNELLALNGIGENCLIRAGDTVKIPVPTPTAGPTTEGAAAQPTLPPNAGPTGTVPPEIRYQVTSGDTCIAIAQRFNVTVDFLRAQNNLDENCALSIGQELMLVFATATPEFTPAPFVLQTPTPRAGYAAPVLISPQAGAALGESETLVTLQWLTVGLLKPDEWYVVQVQPGQAITVPIYETKATSLKLTQDLLGGNTEDTVTWFVQVKRRAGNDALGNPVYVDVGPASEVRRFTWRKPISTPTPTPG